MGLGFLLWPFRKIYGALKKIFHSKEARAVLQIIVEQLLPESVRIVAEIQEIIKSPSKATVQQIIALYKSFGVAVDEVIDTVEGRQVAVRDLAVILLQQAKSHVYDLPLLHSAIELALSKIQVEER